MARVGNLTCVRFENVVRHGGIHNAPHLFVKGTWLPSAFSISVHDGSLAWTGKADKDFILNHAGKLGMTESEYVDTMQCYFSEQQPDATYELRRTTNSSAELRCYKESSPELVLRFPMSTNSDQTVAIDMVQLLLDAYHQVDEVLAKKIRAHDREIAAKELALASLKNQLEERGKSAAPNDYTNGQPNDEEEGAGGLILFGEASSRGKRKSGGSNVETSSRKRMSTLVKTSDALPLYQKPGSPEASGDDDLLEKQSSPSAVRPPLSALGYKQPAAAEERHTSFKGLFDEIGAEANKERSNVAFKPTLSDETQTTPKKPFLDHFSDATTVLVSKDNLDPASVSGRKGGGKYQGRSGGRAGGKVSKKYPPPPSVENSVEDQVEDVVEKSIKCVDNIVSTPLSTAVKPRGAAPTSAKKSTASKSSSKAKKSGPKSGKRKSKPVVAMEETSLEVSEKVDASEEAEVNAKPEDEDTDRIIAVQSAEFHDFDQTRTESDFKAGDFWALYDDQDSMPRFYARVLEIITDGSFQVQVQWLEPYKPSLPANGLVKTAHLSASCGEFTLGTLGHENALQNLGAFSHKIKVGEEAKKMVKYFPRTDEIWALYRHWDKKQVKKDDQDELKYSYDLVQVKSTPSPAEGVDVVPLAKVAGFKSLFTVADAGKFTISYKQLQARFSHCIPAIKLSCAESPGTPVGSFELDPASTPTEYLGIGDSS